MLRFTNKITLCVCVFVIRKSALLLLILRELSCLVFGLLGGGAATFSAIRELSTTKFKQPCYVAAFTGNFGTDSTLGHSNCCGPCQDISRFGNTSEILLKHCSTPELKYYGYNQCTVR